MPARRPYDKFMVHQGTMRDPKVRRLLDPEFRAFAACLCLASQSPQRGVLLVSLDEPLSAAEVADEAGGGVTEQIAQDAIDKLVALGTLIVEDPDTGALAFGNWGRYNPEPKRSDQPEATRERQREKRRRDRDARRQAEEEGRAAQLVMGTSRTGPVRAVAATFPKPPPINGGGRRRDLDRWREWVDGYVADRYPSAPRRQAIDAVTQAIRYGGATSDDEVDAHLSQHFPGLCEAA